MVSHFRMSARALLDEAMQHLARLGCLVERAHGDERLLIVRHHEDLETEVRRVVESLDPAARQVLRPEAS
jgi:hypothetical protein